MLPFPSFRVFLRHIVVRVKPAVHGYHVRLAGSDDLLRLRRVFNRTYHRDKQVREFLFDALRKFHVQHLFHGIVAHEVPHVIRLSPYIVDAR